MGLRMKNVCGVSLKNLIFGRRVHKKPIYRGELPKTRGLGQFADLKGAFYWGTHTPMHIMAVPKSHFSMDLISFFIKDKTNPSPTPY